VRGSDHRDAELARCLDSGNSEREFGRHVDHIRAKAREILHHVTEPGEGPLDIRVKEQRDAGRAMDFGAVALSDW
jgi:hypothetical protein